MDKLFAVETMTHVKMQSRETILVVEDDEPLLRLLRFCLVDAGYTVMSAKNGEEAVDTYATHHGEIDLVITDLGLPGLTGKDEVLLLERINPEVRIICASGYIVPVVEKEMMQAGAKAVVNKPYAPLEVLQTVRTVLDS
jgi:two-component system, cell cycle sensor histidine kinase and response regulator CckA